MINKTQTSQSWNGKSLKCTNHIQLIQPFLGARVTHKVMPSKQHLPLCRLKTTQFANTPCCVGRSLTTQIGVTSRPETKLHLQGGVHIDFPEMSWKVRFQPVAYWKVNNGIVRYGICISWVWAMRGKKTIFETNVRCVQWPQLTYHSRLWSRLQLGKMQFRCPDVKSLSSHLLSLSLSDCLLEPQDETLPPQKNNSVFPVNPSSMFSSPH